MTVTFTFYPVSLLSLFKVLECRRYDKLNLLKTALQGLTANGSCSSWPGTNAGDALSGFVNGALTKASGAHPDVQGWYAVFLQNVILPHANVWSHIVAYGELAVGIALILGAFTGIAAFFGLFMNLNYLLAGTVSINPVLFTLSIGVLLAWRVAGYWGLDYYLLKYFGVPWGSSN